MKLKRRLGLLLIIISIIFIGFVLILYSKIQQNNGEYFIHDLLSVISNEIFLKTCNNIYSLDNYVNETKSNIISCFLIKYNFNKSDVYKISPWTLASSYVTNTRIHPDYFPELGYVLNAMSKAKILKADVGYKGTQLKLLLTLSGGQRVAFKPKWYLREEMIVGTPYEGKDRHNGEIVAFHLNRILGFNRAPLIVGRVINLKNEIYPVATPELSKTFYLKNESYCFYGKCHYCKGVETGVCADNMELEGSISLFLPSYLKLTPLKHPWARTYRSNKKAMWQYSPETYCKRVESDVRYKKPDRLLLDILDTCVLDYLIGNADRHQMEFFKRSNESMLILFDNGKSFGNPLFDEESILAPLEQCCKIRKRTWNRLKFLQDGVLSTVLEEILKNDPIAPVLHYAYYFIIDRRLKKIIEQVQQCIDIYGEYYVLINYI